MHSPFMCFLHDGRSLVPFGAVPVRRILDPPGDLDVLSREKRRP